jgi:hypothetical protein
MWHEFSFTHRFTYQSNKHNERKLHSKIVENSKIFLIPILEFIRSYGNYLSTFLFLSIFFVCLTKSPVLENWKTTRDLEIFES